MTESAISIVMHGTGRMAGAVVDAIEEDDDFQIIATVGPDAPGWGLDAPHFLTLDQVPELPALLIDFSLPDGTRSAAQWCASQGVPMLSGVTGLSADVESILRTAAEQVPVLSSPNLSLGINLIATLARQAAAAMGPKTPVAIEDIHHQWKRDAPSGTALMLGEAISDGLHGEGDLKYSSVRKGDEVGVHTVTLQLKGEEVELVHRAHNRSIYALGALSAAKWLLQQQPGLYSATEWLAGRISDAG